MLERIIKNSTRYLSVIVALCGLSVLAGWIFDISALKSVYPGLVSMKANTALSFLFIGTALYICTLENVSPKLSVLKNSFSTIALLIGAATLAEYIFNANFGIDETLFREVSDAVKTSHPGRMSPLTAVNFICCGCFLFFAAGKSGFCVWLRRIYLVAIGSIAYFVLLTYIFSVSDLSGLESYTQMAIHTSVAFLLFFIGAVLLPSRGNIVFCMFEESFCGRVIRRLWPAAVILPALLGWFRLLGEKKHLYSSEFGVALFVVVVVVVFSILILWVADVFHDMEEERAQNLEALQNSNSMVQSLLKAIPFGISVVDHNHQILFMNEHLEKTIGESAIGKKCWSMLRDNRQQCSDCPLQKHIEIGETSSIDTDGILGGKSFEISHTGMMYEGKPAVLEVYHDITDRVINEHNLNKAYSEILKAYYEIKKLSDRKSEIVALVSHELRTPLTIIKEEVSMLLDKIAGEINEKQQKILATSKKNLERLERVIDDFLNIERIEAGKMLLKKKPIDIAKVIIESAAPFDSRIKNKNLSLKLNIPCSGLIINADYDKMEQVFTNLLGNAVKFTNKGHIEVSVLKVDGGIECSVADTGIGIEKSDM
ncbi:MAG: PAS domain-containing sensor histidine kinase, partial [Deltaproteobacteria bacterium]|nr:PAS domain-containing sensor histidine kinase [Deltaproteobacteria bacterium]